MTRDELQRRMRELGPWFYPFDFGDGVRATTRIPAEVEGIFETRLEMTRRAVKAHFQERLGEISCLDVGCHEGFYTVEMARLGIEHVVGMDVRESNLRKAEFVAGAMGYPWIEFRQGNCEQLNPADCGHHDLTLFLGVLYHLENPMLCLRNLSAVTGEVCIVETQVIDEVPGETEWGSRAWTRPYEGVMAMIDESGDFDADIHETGATPVAFCPSPKALIFLLRHAGFRKVEMIQPPDNAYEQLARGKRVLCAAYK